MPPYAVEPGTRLVDRYRLDQALGEAGGTSYWQAQDELLDRPVGVCLLAGDTELSRGVLSAARRAAAVSDPRFLRVLDASEVDDVVYVVTEWVRARSLADLLERGPLPAGEAREMAVQVAEALAAAHEQGLHHLCLQPEHVLRTSHGQIKIAGLGVDAAVRQVPVPDPEEALRQDTSGAAAVLYAALTARWPGDDGDTTLPAAPQDANGLCSPRQVRAGIPDDLDELVCRALGTRLRHGATPVETLQDLATGLASTQATSRIPVVQQPVERDDDTPFPPPTYLTPYDDSRPPRSLWTRAAWVAVVLILAVGLGLAGWQLVTAVGNRGEDDPNASGTSTSRASPSAANRPVRVTDVTTLDPPPAGNSEENDDRVARVADGDADTVWTTKRYNEQFGPGGLKRGVGVVLDLGREREVSSVTVALEGSGTDLELRAASSAGEAPADYEVVAEASDASGRAELRADEPATARYLLLWLTALPSVDGGYRAGVSEVTVRS